MKTKRYRIELIYKTLGYYVFTFPFLKHFKMNTSYSIEFLISFTNVNGYFTTPVIAGIGFVLNLITLCILSRFKIKQHLKFMIVKVSLEMISCLLAIGFQNILCFSNCGLYPLWFLVYRRFFYYVGACVYYSTGFVEICLMYERYLVLKNTRNWFNSTVNFKYITLVCVVLPFILFLPTNFSTTLVPISNQTYFYRSQITDFGRSTYNYYYNLVMNLLPNFITIVCLLVLTRFVLVEYNKFMHNKQNVKRVKDKTSDSSQDVRLKKKESNFVKMIITLNFFYVLMRLIDLIFNIDYLNEYNKRTFKPESIILRNINFIMIYLIEGINFFILIYWNKEFRRIFKHTIRLGIWT